MKITKTELENLRKQTRKNHKKWIRKKYKWLKYVTELTIKDAHKRQCCVEFKYDYRFITWLIKKKLERKGLWTCLICGKTYAPMWFEEIKIGNSPIRYCKWCRESVMEGIVKNKLEQLK